MTIDASGTWWKGSHLYDLYEYLEHASMWNKLVQPTCDCGCREFFLYTDHSNACAKATCTSCRAEKTLRDSEEQWEKAVLSEVCCPCGASAFQLALGIDSYRVPHVGWVILGFRCVQCGIMGYSPCRSESEVSGRLGAIGGFVDLSSDPRILKAYPLHLYEVIYWGGAYDEDGGDGKDAIYLVAAKDHQDAADIVNRNIAHCKPKDDNPQSDMIQEIANNLTRPELTKILRGPYFDFATRWGPRAWARDPTTGEWDLQPPFPAT